jgi:hypothetical protein
MGRRDIGKRETKKTKKDTKKIAPSSIIAPSPTVEVVKKKRKESREGDGD